MLFFSDNIVFPGYYNLYQNSRKVSNQLLRGIKYAIMFYYRKDGRTRFMSYYNKDDEHKYKFAIWVAVCFGVFLLITIIVVICSIFVYNKERPPAKCGRRIGGEYGVYETS